MTRRLPLCAQCGGTLRNRGRMVLLWKAKPGRPMIGWCEGCDWGAGDLALRRLRPNLQGPSDPEQVDPVLATIEARGPDRVVRTGKQR